MGENGSVYFTNTRPKVEGLEEEKEGWICDVSEASAEETPHSLTVSMSPQQAETCGGWC